MSTAILTEFVPLTNLLRTVPHKAQKGFSWWDIEWTCLDASREFVAVGTDIGIVYLYDRHAGSLQRLHLKKRDEVVSCVKLQSSVDQVVGVGTTAGQVYIFQLPSTLPGRPTQLQLFFVEGVHHGRVTCVEWSRNAMKLFSADDSGGVVCTQIDYTKNECGSFVLCTESHPVVQLRYSYRILLISTRLRTVLCLTEQDNRLVQVGAKPRKTTGPFGATFVPGSPPAAPLVVLAARPGLRLWRADGRDGVVSATYLLRDSVPPPSHNALRLLPDTAPPAPPGAADRQLGPLLSYAGSLLLSWHGAALYLLDAGLGVCVGCHGDVGGPVVGVATCDDEVFVLRRVAEGQRALLRLSQTPGTDATLVEPLSTRPSDFLEQTASSLLDALRGVSERLQGATEARPVPASESSGSLDSAHEASASRAPTPDDDDDGVGVTAVAQLPDDVPHVEVYAATERGREGASVGKGDSEVSAAEDVDGGSSRPPEAQLEHWSSGDTCLELSSETVVAAAAPSASTQEAVEEATAVDPASNGGAVGGDEPAPPRGADDEDSAASTCDKFISIGRENFDDVLFSSRNKKLRRKKKATDKDALSIASADGCEKDTVSNASTDDSAASWPESGAGPGGAEGRQMSGEEAATAVRGSDSPAARVSATDALPDALPDALTDALPNVLSDALPDALPDTLPDALPVDVSSAVAHAAPSDSLEKAVSCRMSAVTSACAPVAAPLATPAALPLAVRPVVKSVSPLMVSSVVPPVTLPSSPPLAMPVAPAVASAAASVRPVRSVDVGGAAAAAPDAAPSVKRSPPGVTSADPLRHRDTSVRDHYTAAVDADNFYAKYGSGSGKSAAAAAAAAAGERDGAPDAEDDDGDEYRLADTWTTLHAPDRPVCLCMTRRRAWCVDVHDRLHHAAASAGPLRWRLVESPAHRVAVSPSGGVVWRLYASSVYAAVQTSAAAVAGSRWMEVLRSVVDVAVDDDVAWYVKTCGDVAMQKGLSRDRPSFRSVDVSCPQRVVRVACRAHVVWALSHAGDLLVRAGVEPGREQGDAWSFLQSRGPSLPVACFDFGPDETAWVVDAAGALWFTTGVTARSPGGSTDWWQVSLGDYLVQDESYAVSGMKQLVSLTRLLQRHARPLISVRYNGVWLSSGDDDVLHVCRGPIVGHRWQLVTPGGTVASVKWLHIDVSIANTQYADIWTQQPNGGIFCFCASAKRVAEVAPPVEGVAFRSMSCASQAVWGVLGDGRVFIRGDVAPHCVHGRCWLQQDTAQLGSAHLVQVCCGVQNVLAVDSDGQIYLRIGTQPPSAKHLSPAWVPLDGTTNSSSGRFTHVYTGANDWMIWALDNSHNVYVRRGVTDSLPIGTHWMYVAGTPAVCLSVSEQYVYAINEHNEVLIRHGINQDQPAGDYWRKIPGHFASISVTSSDELWAVSPEGQLFRRFTSCQGGVCRSSSGGGGGGGDTDWELI